MELRLRVTLVHCKLQSVLCLAHADGDSVVQLFMEEAPVVRLVLDTVDSSPSIWAATTNTCINKWVSVSLWHVI